MLLTDCFLACVSLKWHNQCSTDLKIKIFPSLLEESLTGNVSSLNIVLNPPPPPPDFLSSDSVKPFGINGPFSVCVARQS